MALQVWHAICCIKPMNIDIETLTSAVNMIWLILSTTLVFFMHAGFTMVETGLTRTKNAGNIVMKNLTNLTVGLLAYWAVGWALMYGAPSIGKLFGLNGFFLTYSEQALAAYGAEGMSILYRDWLFQAVFAATAATIVSGAMAERTKFSGYCIYSVFITALIYPISGHWIWGGGWLSELGFHDFAGSTAVHSVGGWAALVGAITVGARRGKYVRTGGQVGVRAIPGHNIPLAALGALILWFGWFGFNAGSTLSGVDPNISLIALNTILAGATGAVAAMILSWRWFGKPDPSMSLNGALAGLVSITAGCATASPIGAIIIGAVGGLLVVVSVEFIDKVLHVDDPVGAISVHGVCGLWGTLAVGLFATGADGSGVVGLFAGGGLRQLGIQALGAAAVFVWVAIVALVLFGLLRRAKMLRVDARDEQLGLDISEHGMEAYSGFQIFTNM